MYVDTFEVTRLAQEIQGQTPIKQFERLVQDLPEQPDTFATWSIKGEVDARGRHFLRVRVRATPVLECQRCLGPMAWPVDADNRLQVVKSEAALDDDNVLDGDPDALIERVVGSRRMDVLALVEDEIILSLPYVSKHDVCPSLPEALEEEPGADTDRPSPFAALGRLKKN
ncbi:DUF177 domain-containing protein [Parapusillimonas sp. SGNA-6]|jgi:uncharacterized protein|nr:DUF177 domain-containing protein [Parapusillimonas sp. SGNA-6]